MYRFCGMCGATLRREAPVEAPPKQAPNKPAPEPRHAEAEPAPSAPRFITEEPGSRSVDYLLEEEPPKSHTKLFATLLLLVLAGSLMVWHWKRDGYPWASNPSSPAAPSTSVPSAQSTGTDVAPNSQPESQPTPSAAEESAAATKPTSPPAQPVASSPPPSQPAESKPENAAKNTEQQPEPASTPAPASSATDQANPVDNAATDNSTAADASPPAPAAAAAVPPAPTPKPKPQAKPVVPATPVLKGDDKLVADGERYLYGNGVPENCDLAQKNLRVAAGHSNARALTLMGAMYATGHCVARDLPTSYRWFAKALHQDPSNARVQQDLEMLWKQMTPEERQLAVKSGG